MPSRPAWCNAVLPVIACAATISAGTIEVREGANSPLLGVYTGSVDNAIHGHVPDLVMGAEDAAVNLGSFYPEPRAVLFRFPLSDPILSHLAGRLISARFTVTTVATSASADQDMPVSFATLTPANASWLEPDVTWRHQRSSMAQPWAGGTQGPLAPGVDYQSPVRYRIVPAEVMNQSGLPVTFAVPSNRVRDWILVPSNNAGMLYWSTLIDNGGADLDDNFQVASSEAGNTDQRPALRIRYASPFTRAVFDQADQLINGGAGYTQYENTAGALSWGEAYIMRAYLRMYQATGDTYYLGKLVTHADAVLAKRDDVNPATTYTDPAWSFGSRGYESAAVTTGHILQGLAEFARIVNADPTLSFFAPKATEYIARTQESINFINTNFLFYLSGNRAAYRPFLGQPYRLDAPNADAAMGSVLYDMYHATGDVAQLTLARQIAQTQETSAFFLTERGNQAWSYTYHGAGDPEDFSHAAHVAPFLAEMGREGTILSDAQVASIVRTVLEEGFLGGGNTTAGIEGSTSPEARIGSDPFVWNWGLAGGLIDLAQYDLRLLPATEAAQLRHYGLTSSGVGWPLLGIANLVRFNQVPQAVKLRISARVGEDEYGVAYPAVCGMAAPARIALENRRQPGDVRLLTVELGGSGDAWARQWDLTTKLTTADPILLNAEVSVDVALLDGYENVKRIVTATPRAGFLTSLRPEGQRATLSGPLSAQTQIVLSSDEHTLVTLNAALSPADLNRDGYVDGADLALLRGCLGAVGLPPALLACDAADLDWDNDVDIGDFALLQRCYSGQIVPADPDCASEYR